ncbi:MAG: GNAT family N-acetyltransferase [Verrucomicrobia bacterium]|nr:GNAT family N-acetyltransferase [Verrucomicrobiota bacterium]
MTLEIRSTAPEDLKTVRLLAERIWPGCYGAMLPPGQIRYMLDWMYAPHRLRSEWDRGVRYRLAFHEGKPVGYLAWEREPGTDSAFLNKLYLVPELQGRGHGQELIRWTCCEVSAEGIRVLELRVNRQNQKAIRAYDRAGFVVVQTLVTDIGAGFVMDDFLMRMDLEGVSSAVTV